MLRFIVGTVLALRLLAVAEAAPNRFRVYPNPSIVVFAIAQGPDGFLWLAGADGLYRFDGFHYQKITTFPFGSARFVAFTADGSLWSAGFEGLTRFRKNGFEVLLTNEVNGMASYPDQLFISYKELARVRLDGSISPLPHSSGRDLNIDSSGKLWFVCRGLRQACSIDPNRPETLQSIGIPLHPQSAVPDFKGRIWAGDDTSASLLENGRPILRLHRQASPESRRPGPLLPGQNRQIWFLGETIRGLTTPIEFQDRTDHHRYPPISGYEDNRGHLWVALLGRGLIEWIPAPDWQRWSPEDFSNEPAVQVVRDQQGSPVLATHKNVYRLNPLTGKWSPIVAEEQRFDSLLPLEDGGFLATTRPSDMIRLSRDGRVVERMKDLGPNTGQYREIVRDGKGRLWVGTKRMLMRIEGHPGSFRLRRENLPDSPAGEPVQAQDLEVDTAGRLWVGYAAGLAWLDDQDKWHKIVTDQPVTMVRSFALAGDEIWVAHRRAGLFSRLQKNGDRWTVTHFSATAGYTPVDTHFLKRDSRGWIWRGSPLGVHISDGRRLGPDDWIHIQPVNGLAVSRTDLYGFFEDTDGSVWIAGVEGVTRFRPSPAWFDAPRSAPPPQITRIEADGRVAMFPEPLPSELPTATKILRIDVGSLNASLFRDAPLRYRFLPLSTDWQLSQNGTLEFRNLSDNAYTLELGYAGAGPSSMAAYPLRIGSPGSTLSWLWKIGLFVAMGALVPIVRYVPGFDIAKFRLEKAVFVLRRRYSHRSHQSPAGTLSNAHDYSGQILLEHYHLTRILSRGGFSVVYEARDLRDGNVRLAVKVINRSSGQESWVRDRFAHEVSALRSVQHPGVVRILDSWISPAGEPCLAMPLLEGKTLRAALEESSLSLRRVARIVKELGAALSEVHEHGIIHRDLKPENLMLLWPGTDREQPVILDFGTAGLKSADNELAATTLMAGSFHYMAPERLTGRYSPASDVFSLAVIVLEMIAGKRLADLNAMFSDASFQEELENTLRCRLNNDAAKILADCLAPAYNPEPRRRPREIKTWAEGVAAALDQT